MFTNLKSKLLNIQLFERSTVGVCATLLNDMTSKKQLSIKEKLDIIGELDKPNPPSKRQLGRVYKVDESSIRYIWKTRETIKGKAEGVSEDYKSKKSRFTSPKFSLLEDTLYEWINQIRNAKIPVPPSLTLVKARQIADSMNIPEEDFKASWGWFQRFKKRKCLKGLALFGEAAEVNRNDPTLLAQLQELYDTIGEYEYDNVYNMDETGLFFRMLPKYTLLMPNEDLTSVRGRKKSKDRVTIVVCSNASGSHKLPCAMIGKSKTPACINKKEWPLVYFNQARAWMDQGTYKRWFDEVFYPEVQRKTSHPVLLLLDNAPGHLKEFQKNNVRVKFFPPNCTSWKQPCDLGIIAALKKRYKFLYLKEVLNFYQLSELGQAELKVQARSNRRGSSGVSLGQPAHLLARCCKFYQRSMELSHCNNSAKFLP